MNKNLQAWILATRPKTLWAAVAPILIGIAMAYGDDQFYAPAVIVALVTALLIQIGTNLANDYFDYVKGADTEERLGPTRVTQAGLIAPQTVKKVFIVVFFLAFLGGLYLTWRGGEVMLVIAIVSIISGILYTGGPAPLGYLGLGDIFVLVFFGPIAVAGTHYIQALSISEQAIIAGIGAGMLSTAILAVNNLRDADTDAKAGKKTLAVRFGKNFARAEYIVCFVVALLVPVYLWWRSGSHVYCLLSLLIVFPAIPTIKKVLTLEGKILNECLASTAKLLLLYSILFSIGWII